MTCKFRTKKGKCKTLKQDCIYDDAASDSVPCIGYVVKPKVNTASKGRDIENKAKDYLKAQGYEVERTYRKAIWVKGRVISLPNDFFGCMDLIAIRTDKIKFIQVTTAHNYSAKTEEILGHKWPKMADVEVWAWYGGRKRKKRNNNEGDVIAQCFKIYRVAISGTFILMETIDPKAAKPTEQQNPDVKVSP